MDKPISQISVAAQVAARIDAEIRKDIWTEFLPGERTLAQRYAVNRKSCSAAVAILKQSGRVKQDRPGGRLKIVTPDPDSETAPRLARLRLLIIHSSHNPPDSNSIDLLRRMQTIWERTHGEVSWGTVDYLRVGKPDTLLKALIARHHADALLLYLPSQEFVIAAVPLRPCYLVGGFIPDIYTGDLPMTVVGHSISEEIRAALSYLHSLGHRRILQPLESQNIWMQVDHIEAMKALMPEAPETGRWEDYCPVFSENVPEVWPAYWRKAFDTIRPTAVVVQTDTHLLSLYGYCHTMGLRIPADISVVSMIYDPRLLWCLPVPTMMRFPNRKGASHFKKWLTGGMRPTGIHLYSLDLVHGGSVAKAPPWVTSRQGQARDSDESVPGKPMG